MKIKVKLLKNVKGLGNAKSIVSVSRGYALNFLIPNGLAEQVSDEFEETSKLREQDIEERRKNTAEKEKQILESKALVFKAKSGEQDKIFGSITSNELSERIKSVFGLEIDRKKIDLESPIKRLGKYIVNIKLYKTIQADLNVLVVKEE
ncbi:MAG: 50S ribosomal protein L9 [Caldisericaceae bacterium]